MNVEAAALIAGGRSRRMGRDKCTLDWHGEPLFQRQLRVLASAHARHLWVVAPERPSWLPDGTPWLCDRVMGSGPLGGILAVLDALTTGAALVLAVDMPNITEEFISTLVRRSSCDVGLVPRVQGCVEPLAAVYPKAAHGPAWEAIRAGRLALLPWARELERRGIVSFWDHEGAEAFKNLNYPEDLR